PELVGPRGGEAPLDEIRRPRGPVLGPRRDRPGAAPAGPAQAQRAHQPFHRAARHTPTLALQLPPHFPRAIHAMVRLPHALNGVPEDRVPLRPRAPRRRHPLLMLMPVVGRRSDRQDRADRLDSVRGPLLVDESHHHFGRRSSSACAKYADALRKISLARFSSSTSRSNAFTRCRSSVVAPGRVPPSRSAWRTHRRNASAVQPSLPAIDRIAAHCDAWTLACSKTIRTARSRNSGAYRVPVDIGSILSRKEPSDKPGAVHLDERYTPTPPAVYMLRSPRSKR